MQMKSVDLSSVLSLNEFEPLAAQRLPPDVWSYIQSGASDGYSTRRNADVFSHLALQPRVLRDMAPATTKIDLLGQRHASPILIAPMAYQKLLHIDGELATVHAASSMGIGCVVSTQSSVTLEDLAQVSNAPLWFQLYPQADRSITLDLVRRAEHSGYQAIVLTVDAPIQGFRHADRRAGFQLPPGVQAVNLARYVSSHLKNTVHAGESVFSHPLVQSMLDWKSVAQLIEQTRLPVLLKGVLHPADAELALEIGVSGIVVSNHGGRVLDTVVDALTMLPQIAAVVRNRVPLLMDGGVRRGTDVLKCLAAGADAVFVGRPVLHALAVAGATGVAHALHLLKTELEMAMVLTGVRNTMEARHLDLLQPSTPLLLK